jgi:DNA-binding transcriptional MocR family regulator
MTEHYRIRGRTSSEIAASVERLVGEGRLGPGARLPTVRELATGLEVAPATVAAAYRELARRGVTEGAGRLGTRVRPAPPLPTAGPAPLPEGVVDLVDGGPDPALLPTLRPALRALVPSRHGYLDPPVLPDLESVARSMFADDGVPEARLAVVSGALDGVERVLEAHLRAGDRVAVEDPGFPAVHDVTAALGLRRVPVAVDDEGVVPDALGRALRAGLDALIIAPRAQNPTGAALSDERVRALRRVLRPHPDVLVLEDDHAGPIAGAPARTLAEPRRGPWAVVRSVSKALGPDLRVALVTGDDVTIDRVEGRQRVGPGWVSHLLQQLLVALWRDDAVHEALARAETTYARRRDALLDALAHHGIDGSGRSGLNVWIPVPAEDTVVAALLTDGWGVSAGQRFRIASPPAVRVNVARLSTRDAPALARSLATALRPRYAPVTR